MKDSLTIKNYNKVMVQQDTVIIIPSKPAEVHMYNVNYSLQFWALLLIMLIFIILWYFKKVLVVSQPPISVVSQWDPNYVAPSGKTTYTQWDTYANTKAPINIDGSNFKVNLNATVGESNLVANKIESELFTDEIKDKIKKLRKE